MQTPQQLETNISYQFTLQQLSSYKKAIINLQLALQKPIALRHQSQNQTISAYAQLSPYFKQLSRSVSADFAKNLIKSGHVYCIKGKKRVYHCNDRITKIFIPLIGTFSIIHNSQNQTQPQSVGVQMIKLMNYQIKHSHRKKNNNLDRRTSLIVNNSEISSIIVQVEEINKGNIFQNQGRLLVDGVEGELYTESLYVKDQGWLLGINIDQFYNCLQEQYTKRILEKISWFRKLRCFDSLDEQQLKLLVEKIPLITLKKDDFVFKQGDNSIHMYLLIEGQAKAQRTVNLFKQDPNALYQSRSQSQAGRRCQKPKQFSYADFQGVYNYTPQKKKIDIGIIAPVTVFGQQEVITELPRQTDVQITSTSAKMFIFCIKGLENITGGKKAGVDRIMSELFESITSKRIETRRQILSNTLELQNRRNMNYFFLEQPQQIIKKRRIRTAKERINRSLSSSQNKQRMASKVKPRYDSFNFQEFLRVGKKKSQNIKFTPQETRVAKLTHSMKEIEGKVRSECLMSVRVGAVQNINIITPLFDANYYKIQRKQLLRIQNKKRMRMLAVTQTSNKSSRNTSNHKSQLIM